MGCFSQGLIAQFAASNIAVLPQFELKIEQRVGAQGEQAEAVLGETDAPSLSPKPFSHAAIQERSRDSSFWCGNGFLI